ncbi:MAG: peptidoglycan DD-metalloendopeptidase family protein [Balneolaceae bacterium]
MHRALYSCAALLLIILLVTIISGEEKYSASHQEEPIILVDHLREIPPVPELDEYGFRMDRFERIPGQVSRNESLYIILRRHGVSPRLVQLIQQAASEYVNINRLIPGQNYVIYRDGEEANAFVWNRTGLDHLIVTWDDEESVSVRTGRNEPVVREMRADGVIRSSLWETLQESGVPTELAPVLAEVFAWEVNFFALREGDQFRVIYNELYLDDEPWAIERILAAEFVHRGEPYRAYYFDNGERRGYFNEEGNSLQRELLKAPFNYSPRVSSGFSHNRYHPILQQNRPHYGVDFAAPRGTPIIAAGDGEIVEARYRGGNGNIIQIRHNSVYKTAYLHLDRFASGVRPGTEVRQGEVIGYVGSTGLATGPHLCYRLYRNDSPVNSLTIDLPASDSIEEEFMEEYQYLRRDYDVELERIQIQQQERQIANRLN